LFENNNFTQKYLQMTTTLNAYDSLAEFMASLDPVKVLSFHAPIGLQERVEELLERQQESSLPITEKEELDHYLILEHIVRLAKSRARLRLAEHKV
jgi:hypothetical protein